MLGEHRLTKKNQITTRLRVALLVCAAAAAAIPVIVYLTTAEVMRRQEDLSKRLISSAAQSAELNASLIRLAEDTDKLGGLDAAPGVRTASTMVLSELETLRSGFAAELSASPEPANAARIMDLLREYKAIVGSVAENRIAQLENLETIGERDKEIRQLLRRTNAELSSLIATTSDRLERQISVNNQNDGRELRAEFRQLTLFQAVRRLLDDIEERVADIESAASPQRVDAIAAELRFLTRGLATRTAKLSDPVVRERLVRNLLLIEPILLGPESIITLQQDYLEQTGDSNGIRTEETRVADELMGLSRRMLETSQANALRGSDSIADLVRDNRLTVLGLSSLLLLVLFGLLFYLVGERFSRRIARLTDGVLAIADGDIDHKIDIGGNDELTAMGDALKIFRDNRLALVRTNKELEERNSEVRELGTRLQTILDTTTSGIVAFDQDNDIILANLPARHFMGGISDDTPFAWPDKVDFVDGENLSRLEASNNPIRRALAGQELKGEIALIEKLKNSEARYMRISSANVTDQTSPVRCVVVLEDISDAEKNRQQVERSSRLDALGQLTGGIAHDFNNLLATIQYANVLALGRIEDVKTRDYLETALASVNRGADLTTRLLAFAKSQPGLAKSMHVDDILDEFRKLTMPVIEEAIKLSFVIHEPGLRVYCDVAQLENALLNLVLNSRDAIMRAGEGGQITVSARAVAELDADVQLRRENPNTYIAKGLHAEHAKTRSHPDGFTYRYIEFSVTDDGPGMNEEIKRRALDPFFTTKQTNSGTGLGLSMVYGFIQQADGELRIYSEPGHGTTIRLLLPRGTDDGLREKPVARLDAPKGQGQCILIAEDEAILLQALEDIIRSLGYETISARNGEEALAIVQANGKADLLLTDIVMPGRISGFELAREVRNLRPEMPVIYMSGYTGFSAQEMGDVVAPLVQKPCPPAELAQALNDALSRTAPDR